MNEILEPTPFPEALEKFRQREVLPADFDTFQWQQVPVAIRERAFFSARVESARLLDAMQGYFADYLAEARTDEGRLVAQGRAQFVDLMRRIAIEEGLGRVDPETGEIDPVIRETDLQDIRSLARLQLIFDTQVEAAQEYGFWRQGLDPAVLAVFPASRFIRVRPVMVPRDYHEANEGVVRLKSDLDFWLDMNRDFGVPWGPWGFNSGMGTEDVDREEAEALGLLAPGERVSLTEADLNERLGASVAGLAESLVEELREATGGTVAEGRLSPREVPAEAPTTLGSPVSEKIDTHTGSTKNEVEKQEEVLRVIDKVHGDGPLLKAPVRWVNGTTGSYQYRVGIKVGRNGEVWRSQLVHEIGHKLDYEGFGDHVLRMTSTLEVPEMKAVLDAIRKSKAVEALMIPTEEGFSSYREDEKYRKYLVKDVELWARAYTQFIAEESQDAALLADIATRRNSIFYDKNSQWETADFLPIRKAIRSLFEAMKWMKPTNPTDQ